MYQWSGQAMTSFQGEKMSLAKDPKFQRYAYEKFMEKYPNIRREQGAPLARNFIYRSCKAKRIVELENNPILDKLMKAYEKWCDNE